MKPPLRLRDDPAVAVELRRDLARAATAPAEYDVAAGLAAFEIALAAPAMPAAPPSATAHAASGGAQAAAASGHGGALATLTLPLKAALALAGSAGLMALGWSALDRSSPAPKPRAPSVSAPADPAARAPLPKRAAKARASHRPRPGLAPVTAAGPSSHVPPIGARANALLAAQSGAAHDDRETRPLRREIAQLGRIDALLESDPAAAYTLARAGEREFGRGMLGEERQALSALALWRMGERSAAQRKAQVFLDRYPNSPLRARLQELLEPEAEP